MMSILRLVLKNDQDFTQEKLMNQTKKILAFAALSFIVAGQAAVRAQGPGGYGGGGFANALRVTGPVSAVDTTADLITVTGRGDNAVPLTVKYDTSTTYTKQVVVPLSTLQVGGVISVNSATPPQPGDTSIDATRITVLPAMPPAPAAPPAGGGGFGGGGGGGYGGGRRGGRGVVGTIATTTPTLTITTPAGVTETVNTDAETVVSATQPGTIADVLVGSNVNISVKTDANATLIATDVAIVPARAPRGGGGG
jgi:hypothetical protein